MRKIFTFAAAVLMTMSMWADTMVNLPTDLKSGDLKRGYSYMYAVGSGSVDMDNNSVYFSSYDYKIEGGKINPYRTCFVFKPLVSCNMAYTLAAGSSERTQTVTIYEINEKLFEVYSGGDKRAMATWIKDHATDEDLKGLWVTVKVTQVDKNGNVSLRGDSAKALTGYNYYKELLGDTLASYEIKVGKSSIVVDTIKDGLDFFEFKAGKAYMVFNTVSSSSGMSLGALDFVATCEAPAEALKIEASKTENVNPGEVITFTISGGNGGETKIEGWDGETIADNKWTAVKGDHVFTVSQDVKDGKCNGEASVIVKVLSNDPVTAAHITGDQVAYIGVEIELTCISEDATDYQWYQDGKKIEGATEYIYKFTPAKEGETVFACEAWNKYNEAGKPFKTEDYKVTVYKEKILCGELIKATMQQEVTGVVGGTVETNLSKGEAQKLNKKKYFGITLKEGEFKAGDKFIVNITVAPDVASKMGTMKLYADKDGAEKVFEADSAAVGVVGENTWKLPVSVEGKQSLYIYRGDVDDWNPTFSYVAVVRPCQEESSDATLGLLSINGGTIDAKDGVYPDTIRYEVPLDSDKKELEIFASATDKNAEEEYPAKVLVPEIGAAAIEVKINITAQDGTKKEYVLVIYRPEASHDATIKDLYIAANLVTAVKDTFSYEVPGEWDADSIDVTIVLNDPYAVCDKGTDFKMLVPQPKAAPTKEVLKVTAQDLKTIKEYVILLSKAEKPDQGIDEVSGDQVQSTKVLIDGQLYILKNGILYNAQGAIAK